MKLAAALLLIALAACGSRPTPSSTSGASPSPSHEPTQIAPDGPDGGGPRNSFIVCPGNPRCPPDGSQPGGR